MRKCNGAGGGYGFGEDGYGANYGSYHNYDAAYRGRRQAGGGRGSQPGTHVTISRTVTSDSQYTLTFDTNPLNPDDTKDYPALDDTSTQSWTRTVTVGETTVAALEKIPTRTGYKFDGFYTGKTDGVKVFNADGTPNYTTNENMRTTGFSDPRNRWAPGDAGGGWNGTAFALSGTNVKVATNFRTTLYAYWKKDTSKVLLDASGGSSSLVKDIEFMGNPNLNVAAPKRPGYTFAGYYMSRDDGAEQVYDANLEYTKMYNNATAQTKFLDFTNGTTAFYAKKNAPDWDAVGDASNPQRYVTYYAHWNPVTYHIQYMSYDSAIDDDAIVPLYDSQGNLIEKKLGPNQETYYSVEEHTYGTFELPSAGDLGLTRDHYIFKGWNVYASQDWKMYMPNKTYKGGLGENPDQVVTMYAAWEPQGQVDMIYEANGGVGAPSRGEAYKGPDESYSIAQAPNLKRDGYTFLGWNTSSDGSDKDGWYIYNANGEEVHKRSTDPGWSQVLGDGEEVTLKSKITGIDEGKVFYAIWAQDPTITYNPL